MLGTGKILIFSGLILVGTGVLFLGLEKIPGLGRLPGDILIKKPNMTFYFPLTTCLLLSVLISLILYLIRRYKNEKQPLNLNRNNPDVFMRLHHL